MTDLWSLRAHQIADLIRSRDLSCVEVVEAALRRVDETNPAVNAIVDRLDDAALAQAKLVDSAVLRGEASNGALVGVPFTAKLNSDYEGLATTNGVRGFADRIAARDNPCIGNLKRAGAICIGRTNVPAFSARYFTDRSLWAHAESLESGDHAGGIERWRGSLGRCRHGPDRSRK